MRKHSVNVLDEADAFEDKLNWQLFKMEQDARLFGPKTHEGDWVPGDYNNSKVRARSLGHGWMGAFRDDLEFNTTSWPTIHMGSETVAIPEFNDVDVDCSEFCPNCEVYWWGPDACWICEDPDTIPKTYTVFDDFDIDNNTHSFRSEVLQDIDLNVWRIFGAMNSVVAPVPDLFIVSTTDTPRAFNGTGILHSVVDEAIEPGVPIWYAGVDFDGDTEIRMDDFQTHWVNMNLWVSSRPSSPIQWPDNVSMEPEIPLPGPVFPAFEVNESHFYPVDRPEQERRSR